MAAAARADAGEACCVDLEQRVAGLEAMAARKGNRKVLLKVSGYLNEDVMYWDDGFADNVYFVTNETERSRVNFIADVALGPKWSAGAIVEIGIRGNRENQVDQIEPLSPLRGRLPDPRYTNWFVKNDDLGKFEMGIVRMATYHIVHMMTSETYYFARHGIGTWIGSEGSGFFLRKEDGTLTSGPNALRWGDIDAHGPNAAPGEGLRLDAVKYETPDIAGFMAAAGYSGQGAADVALRYTGDVGDMKLVAGIGYGQYWRHDVRRCAVLGNSADVRCRALGLSASAMHKPTGLYVYGAYGQQRDLNARALFQAPVEDVDRAYYLQAGVERKLVDAGNTTIFAEYEHDSVGAGVNPRTGGILNTTGLGPSPLPPGDTAYNRMAASSIDTWGLGVNQSIDAAALDLYVSGRVFSADVLTSATGAEAGGVETPIADFLMIVGGARIEF